MAHPPLPVTTSSSRGKGLLLGCDDVRHTISLYLLPFAGGTSLSYSALTSAITTELTTNNGISSFKFNFEFHPIDLPGRLLKPIKNEEDAIIENVDSLADEVIKMRSFLTFFDFFLGQYVKEILFKNLTKKFK